MGECKPLGCKCHCAVMFVPFYSCTLTRRSLCRYVGEIITNDECRTRLQAQEKAGTESFYMLQLDSDYVIDARRKANQARFANHSCDPNCVTQKWNVNGELRVGIFATKEIPAGEVCDS